MQQLLHPQQFVGNPQSDFGGLPSGMQPDEALRGQWYSKSQDVSHVLGRLPHDQNVQDEFHHRLTGQDGAQLNNLSSEESVIGQSDAPRSAEAPNTSNAVCRSNNLNRERQFKNQQRWLLFLRHARRCPAPEGKCQEPNCLTVQKLLRHMEHCNVFQCSYPRCCATRVLVNHHRRCRDGSCPVCVPVKNYVQQAQLKALARPDFSSGLPGSVNGSCKSYENTEIAGRSTPKTSQMIAETPEDLQPSIKRMKIEQGAQSVVSESEASVALKSTINEPPIQDAQHSEQHHDPHIPRKSEINEVKMEVSGSVGQLSSKMIEMKKDKLEDSYIQRPEGDPTAKLNSTGFGVQEVIKAEKEMAQSKMENPPLHSENISKSGKPKIKGVSLTELFTPEQVRQHITGLRQWVGQSKAKAEKNQAMEHSMSENSCQLCAVEKLTFEPPPIYCTPCGARIKRNAMYYTVGAGETRHYFCIPCYNEARGDTIVVDGSALPKARMEKKKNDEETEEWWVQCDKCEAWQHQICALFNGRRNDGGQAEYTCPNCYIEEVERGERVPLPQSAVLGAKDLPRTILSDHMEQRLFAKLKQERQDRARLQGKSYDEVPGAESLVIRVVSSVDKKLEVKPRFLEIFQEENYPAEYPYKSKIGYLEYCKKRGFTSCYIWACPPLKGEDYILYCHPEIQKTPKSDKLREWYLSMLRKAAKENIVVDLTNLYDHFFVSTGESKAKLGETISPMKEDFIMVHLQHSCTHCCILMVSGNRWVCKQCKNFQLCDKCYDVERKREDRERHPINQKDKHTLYPVEITGVPDDTKDKDEILESEFFDTRQAFLSLCQGNHYQYDTLRRAKHSSMMVLYHLHNPTAPAFVTTCNVCHLDIETGQGWRCETCPDYDVCNTCFQKDGGIDHPHKLTNHPSNDRDAQNKEARQLRVMQLRKMLDLLVHASQCRSPHCQYPNCRKVKGLFRHGMLCKVRASGGCLLCKKMWYLLQLHARACKESECSVPRCRDLKEHMRRLQQQSDSRRRAAVMEMMRQRAAEVAGNS
ncbi:UNVERIFIED_CONTAM: Histone acetyltransferase HAC1 [Sesamum radiatum]|uniref:histone acetyltransferase n=1 Tax=Sesamum radiatum TaxID=300843 RepID=A0AAW2K472_SESRA